ncbi:uncharacterized protein TRIADDRAFT_50218 [Trichoplax adhaerens]|uniref:coproporphyrinogen oxidase n=1 Tax=Trichoplax adhaerens TaxID=10228 RepID=B3RVP9_TRIAD|nr:hypothetical protein TRIADDRAFT_50218 [Trichoplax adhaerens]EDV25538.1 hypothetical protein TRIADDRAFT_50218 [Trichoplax adhaerens]|eukprot:XP_002111571.1 hypothetical protein TRIADDRAFT_50218 [Trichoplax adhaerens]
MAHEITVKNKDAMRTRMELMILKVQADFCKSLQEFDDKEFIVDKWAGKRGSGGVSCIIQNGTVFEKAAILTSVVHGHLSDNAAERLKKRRSDIRGTIIQYFAAGLSVVIHPRNPMIPTFHCNFRYFEIIDEHDKRYWWFGGGVDLTPYYLDVDDVKYFHKTLKYACDTYNPKFYPEFKQQCDRYFYIEHRHERRGVGGIFFDDLDCLGPQGTFEFVKTCAQSIIPCYSAVVKKHLTDAYGYAERQWQLLRRGRYAEFNLIYDRGTKFGLNTPESRVESVLASLPLEARWDYKHSPLPGSKEAELIKVLVKPKDWVTDED